MGNFEMKSRPGKILVLRGGAIGDFILTLPAIDALRRHFPDAHLEVVGYPHIVELAMLGGVVDRVQPIEARGLAGFFARNGSLDPVLSDYFSGFEIIVSYLFDPDGVFQANVARCSGAQFILGPHRPDEAGLIHAAQAFLKPLERLAIYQADPLPRLRLAPRAPRPNRRLALHPGSGSEKKNWPEKQWTGLLQGLTETTALDLLLAGGEAEGEKMRRLACGLPSERVALARSLPLSELAVELQGCCAFAGHDSGISHLAAAIGLPCLLLWGESNEGVWRPPQPGVRILKPVGGLQQLGIEQVAGALVGLLTE